MEYYYCADCKWYWFCESNLDTCDLYEEEQNLTKYNTKG